jgi:5-hydroxyisourate hydrolase
MITTHVLDTAMGGPAVGMDVVLEVHKGSDWVRVSSGPTDTQGRLGSLTVNVAVGPGVYRLTFDTGTYYRDVRSFFPEVQVIFRVREAGEHVHVPLLLSPFGYSTYRGV